MIARQVLRYCQALVFSQTVPAGFASDSPCTAPVPQLQRMLSLPLTDEEKGLLCWKNAARLLDL